MHAALIHRPPTKRVVLVATASLQVLNLPGRFKLPDWGMIGHDDLEDLKVGPLWSYKEIDIDGFARIGDEVMA